MKITTRSLVNSVAVGSVATLAMAFGAIGQAQAATLLTENFDAITTKLSATGTLGNFTVLAGTNVDVIGSNPSLYNFYPGTGTGNGNYIDLNGSPLTGTTTQGTITSNNSFTFTAGQSATLSFNYGKNGDTSAADVFLGTTKVASLTAPSGTTFANFNQTFTAPTNGTLRFVSTNPGNGGIILDNIVLSNSAIVPEPSDFLGTAIAVGSVVMLRRNTIKKTK
jgi:hypothetical protein